MSRHARERNPEIRPSCELPLFEQNFYKFEQTKSCLTAPLSANGESGDCLSGPQPPCSPRDVKSGLSTAGYNGAQCESGDCRSLSGSQSLSSSPRDVARARRNDPQTSRIAAGRVTNSQKVKHAIYRILSIYGPLTDEQLIVQYRRGADMPPASDQSIRSRRSDLVHDGTVCDSGDLGKTEMGNPAIIWKLK